MINFDVCQNPGVMPPQDSVINPAVFWAWILLAGIVPALWLLPGCCLLGARLLKRMADTPITENTPVMEGTALWQEGAGGVATNVADTAKGKLVGAAHAAARLRLRVSGTLAQLGWMLLVLAEANAVFSAFHGDVNFIGSVIGHQLYYIALSPWGIAFILLSLRPVDEGPVMAACVLKTCFLLVVIALYCNLVTNPNTTYGFSPLPVTNLVVCLALFVILAALMFPALNLRRGLLGKVFGPPYAPRVQLRRLWLVARLTCVVTGLSNCVSLLAPLTIGWAPAYQIDFGARSIGSALLLNVISCTLAGLTFTPSVRSAILRWLGSLGKSASREQEAASVAALIASKGSVADALGGAEKHFRACPLSQISLEKLANNQPDPSLHALTSPAVLGEVDGFISHSWSDPGETKYQLLHKWAAATACGSEGPLMWLEYAQGIKLVRTFRVSSVLEHLSSEVHRMCPFSRALAPHITARLVSTRRTSTPTSRVCRSSSPGASSW